MFSPISRTEDGDRMRRKAEGLRDAVKYRPDGALIGLVITERLRNEAERGRSLAGTSMFTSLHSTVLLQHHGSWGEQGLAEATREVQTAQGRAQTSADSSPCQGQPRPGLLRISQPYYAVNIQDTTHDGEGFLQSSPAENGIVTSKAVAGRLWRTLSSSGLFFPHFVFRRIDDDRAAYDSYNSCHHVEKNKSYNLLA